MASAPPDLRFMDPASCPAIKRTLPGPLSEKWELPGALNVVLFWACSGFWLGYLVWSPQKEGSGIYRDPAPSNDGKMSGAVLVRTGEGSDSDSSFFVYLLVSAWTVRFQQTPATTSQSTAVLLRS